MPTAPAFLDPDGSASMGTMFLMSHHGLRRDLALFAIALGDPASERRAAALREEWGSYHAALHGHHTVEDTAVFPDLASKHPDLAGVISELSGQHRRIDPLLERGDGVFARLEGSGAAGREAAGALVRELSELLDAHLAIEEEKIVPRLRETRTFAMPIEGDEMAGMYAQGFAWSSHGVAPEVLAKVYAMLPEALTKRMPAARAAFEARCERVWGSARAGASRTAVPDWIGK